LDPKIIIKIQFMQFALEVVVFEYSFVKHSQGILGINSLGPKQSLWTLVFFNASLLLWEISIIGIEKLGSSHIIL
jgi:hypothetical protein